MGTDVNLGNSAYVLVAKQHLSRSIWDLNKNYMTKPILKLLFVLPLLMAPLLASQTAAAEAELSKVTLFVEGMMKSRGGVT